MIFVGLIVGITVGVILHELGHAFVAIYLGWPIRKIVLGRGLKRVNI